MKMFKVLRWKFKENRNSYVKYKIIINLVMV